MRHIHSTLMVVLLVGACGDTALRAQPDKKTAPRGELKLDIIPTKAGDVELRVALTNTAKDLLVNTWRWHRLDGLRLQVTDEKGTAVRTRLYTGAPDLDPEPKYIVLKPGETRSHMWNFRSIVDGEFAPGKLKVKAVYRNEFQDEVYESKELEMTVRPK